jgi:DNA-binding response OmpR family regulator
VGQAGQTILVVDEDDSLSDGLSALFESERFQPILAGDGSGGLEQALARRPDLILVDLRAPGPKGLELCARLRAAKMRTPIIVLTAVDSEMDVVQLLGIGADDCVRKPFGARELLARIRALLRRADAEAAKVVEFSDTQVDLTRRVVMRRGRELRLTRIEYNLLAYFLLNPDRVLTRDVILNFVWGYDAAPKTRTVDVHVRRLRRKLESGYAGPRHFLTVHGLGYRFLP